MVTGGEIHPQDGSGKITLFPAQVEAGTRVRTFTLTYEAATALGTVNLDIDVKGIVEVSDSDDSDDNKALQFDDSKEYGYVFGSNPDIEPVIADSIDTDGKLITWTGLKFSKAGAKFTMTIKNVDIEENGDSLTWTARIGTGCFIGLTPIC